MRAVVIERTGTAAELQLADWPDPKIDVDEVLVRVRAAGVCGRDLIDRRGGFSLMKLPTVLGHEIAGEVVAVGSQVRSLAPGDRVANLHRPWCGECAACAAGEPIHCERAWQSFGHSIDGGYAELTAASARAWVRMPDGIDFVHAASLGCTAAVALRSLRQVAKLELGETILITGASGGVGQAAVQLAKLMGARVLVTTSSPAKAEKLSALGADEVITIENGRFADRVRDASDGGVHVALELTGAITFPDALRSLRPRGRMVVVGNIDLAKVSISLGPLILFSHSITGMRSYTRADLEDCFRLVLAGKLHPVVDRTLPLERAREAHELLEAQAVSGRIVLVP